MKFTIALTFFAAASALELKGDDSGIMAASGNLIAGIIGEDRLECALGEINEWLDENEIEITWDQAAEYEQAVEQALEDNKVTLDEVKNIFGSLEQGLEDTYAHIKQKCFDGSDSDE